MAEKFNCFVVENAVVVINRKLEKRFFAEAVISSIFKKWVSNFIKVSTVVILLVRIRPT